MSYLDSVFGLDGSIAVVTGGTSGLGAASAIALAKAGAKVVVSGRDQKRGEETVAEIADAGGGAELELADVSDASAVVEFVERVIKRHGPVDILVNAAGVFHRGDAADITLDDWDRLGATNVTSTFLLCQGFGREMIKRGRGKIVNFSLHVTTSTPASSRCPRCTSRAKRSCWRSSSRGSSASGTRRRIKNSIDAQLSAHSITSNNEMMELITDIDNGNNAWAVGRFDAIANQVRLPSEIASKMPAVKTFAVMAHIDGGLTGTLRAEVRDHRGGREPAPGRAGPARAGPHDTTIPRQPPC